MASRWNITKYLLDDAIKRRRMLLGVETGVVREMATIFRDVETELGGKVVAYLGSHDPDTWLTGARQARLLGRLQTSINEAFPKLERTVQSVVREQAQAEAELIMDRLSDAVKQLPEDIPVYKPSTEQLRKLATHGLPKDVTGEMQALDQTIADLKPAAQKRLKRAMQEAVVRGDGAQKIAANVKRALRVTQNEANTLARTMIQRVSNDSARLSYARNQHLVREVQWMATLDKLTCLQCGSQDGRTFERENAPVLPAHYNCRCFLAAVVASWRQLGIPPEKANDDIRRLFDGKPAPRQTYQSWLREQPAATQKTILGESRYRAYSKDAAQIDDFATDRRVLTVEEWKEKAA